MSLNELVHGPNPALDDVQQTDFGYDVVPRYICNNWQEIAAAQGVGAGAFKAVVIGAGMFGGYMAEKLYRLGTPSGARILLLDAGAFLLQSHIQNLPQQLGGKIGGPNYLRPRDDASGTQNVIWGMPWISNEAFSGVGLLHRRQIVVLGRLVAAAYHSRSRQVAGGCRILSDEPVRVMRRRRARSG